MLGAADSEDASPLARPFGIAVSGGALIVADPDAPGVFRLAAEGPPQPIACRNRDWTAPMAVAAGDDGTLFVADGGAPAVVRVEPGGACAALGEADLERPTGVALSGGRLFVVDPPRHQVVVLSTAGRVLRRFGEAGEAPGQLYYPAGIAADADGSLLVVDSLNFRICRFTPEGALVEAFGERGDEDGRLARPKAVAAGPRGTILVTDAQRGLVLAFTRQGGFDFAFGEPGKEPGQLDLPSGIAVDGERVYVASSLNHRIEEYQLLGDVP